MARRPQAKAVLFALADRVDDQGHGAWPGVARIAAEAELCERAVQSLPSTVAEGRTHIGTGTATSAPTTYVGRICLARLDELSAVAALSPVAELQEGTHHEASEVFVDAPLTSPEVHKQTPLSGVHCADATPPEVHERISGVHVQVPGVHGGAFRGAPYAPDPVLDPVLSDPVLCPRARASWASPTPRNRRDGFS